MWLENMPIKTSSASARFVVVVSNFIKNLCVKAEYWQNRQVLYLEIDGIPIFPTPSPSFASWSQSCLLLFEMLTNHINFYLLNPFYPHVFCCQKVLVSVSFYLLPMIEYKLIRFPSLSAQTFVAWSCGTLWWCW